MRQGRMSLSIAYQRETALQLRAGSSLLGKATWWSFFALALDAPLVPIQLMRPPLLQATARFFMVLPPGLLSVLLWYRHLHGKQHRSYYLH